ncbi:MAG TPA: VWA domain-containing protein [Gryllotalpicola sp.]
MITLTTGQRDVVQAWRRGGRFGLLIAGSSWRADALWAQLVAELGPAAIAVSPATGLDAFTARADPWTGSVVPGILTRAASQTLVLGHAAGLDSARAALAASCSRILARAHQLSDIPAPLQPALTALVEPAPERSSSAELNAQLHPRSGTAAPLHVPDPLTAADLSGLIGILNRYGLADHGLDLGAARLAQQIAAPEARRRDAIEETVCLPRRRQDPASPQPEEPNDAERPNPRESEPSPPQDPSPGANGDASETPPEPPEPPETAPAIPKPPRSRTSTRTPLPGRGGPTTEDQSRGRRRRTVPLCAGGSPDVLASVLIALSRQPLRSSAATGRVRILPEDLRSRRRAHPSGRLLILVVDASGSMAHRSIRRAKSIALRHVETAYRDRAHVAVVIARGHTAYLAVPPTRSIRQADHALRSLPTGGGTPLAGAFELASRLAQRHDAAGVDVVALTDGRANIGPGDDPQRDAERALRQLTARVGRVLVVHPGSIRGRSHPSGLTSSSAGRAHQR